MTRTELEHAIRAACDVTNDQAVYVFGSQAILGQYPDAPETLRQSAEADIAPVNAVDMVDVIDANLGELSSFHQAFGYYVHGVPINAAVLPMGWEKRAIAVRNANTNDARISGRAGRPRRECASKVYRRLFSVVESVELRRR